MINTVVNTMINTVVNTMINTVVTWWLHGGYMVVTGEQVASTTTNGFAECERVRL